jgi:hypothetical protein
LSGSGRRESQVYMEEIQIPEPSAKGKTSGAVEL